MKTKDLIKWVNEMRSQNYLDYLVFNGGGLSKFEMNDSEFDIDLNEYEEDAVLLEEGQEYADFNSVHEEGFKYYLIKHKTPYNTENMDIQIAYYEV